MTEDEWLVGKQVILGKRQRLFTKENIETLRKKLIEDVCKEIEITEGIKLDRKEVLVLKITGIINKRFGKS